MHLDGSVCAEEYCPKFCYTDRIYYCINDCVNNQEQEKN